MDLAALGPSAGLLSLAVLLDLLLGDPQYRWHPIRLIGASITSLENGFRRMGMDGYGGGIALGLSSAAFWVVLAGALLLLVERIGHVLVSAAHVMVVYWMLALRSLLDHARAVEGAARSGDVHRAREATALFVARDTQTLDIAACRRAAIESLSENLTDGYVSPLFWYLVAGIPGLVVFKVFSTLDSMVGNKSERYVRFGWFSARTDDVLNWIPARLTWLIIVIVALVVPRCSSRRALVVGLRQHGIVPGPNSGWSEAATAGAIGRRLVGPIQVGGRTVTDLWLGDPEVPPAGHDRRDVPVAMALAGATGIVAAALCIGCLAFMA